MPLFNVFDISSSALHAQNIRLNTVASNLANAETVAGSEEDAYRAKQPLFQEILGQATGGQSGDASGGVRVKEIVESDAPVTKRHAPNHPMANDEGYIFTSNVNPMEETANMMSASSSYQSNVEVMNTVKQLLMRTLSMGQ